MNDLGFQNLADRRLQFAWLGYYRTRPGGPFQRWSLGGSEWRWWDFGGDVVRSGIRADVAATTNGFQDLGISVNRETGRLAVTALRGGPAVLAPAVTEVDLSVSTDSRHHWIARLGAGAALEDETGAARLRVAPAIQLRVGDRLFASTGATLASVQHAWQYVTTLDPPVHLVAALDQTTFSVEVRLEWALTPDAGLQLYAQPFLSAARYARFARDHELRAPSFRDRFRELSPAEIAYRPGANDLTLGGVSPLTLDDPDFAAADTRATSVFRWEYRPGSTLFIVWSHDRPVVALLHDPGLGGAGRALVEGASTHALMIKISYWMRP